MEGVATKTISVLLTEYSDRTSRILQIATRKKYTHVSISIEDYGNRYFSFTEKHGFDVELPELATKFSKFSEEAVSYALYQMEVPEDVYEKIKVLLEEFIGNAKQYRYSMIGAALCFFKIPHRFKNRYFCSQFVAELLSLSGATELRKKPSLYLPADFTAEPYLSFRGQGSIHELVKAS